MQTSLMSLLKDINLTAASVSYTKTSTKCGPQHSILGGQGAREAAPLLAWVVADEGYSFFFNGVATGKMAMLQ